MSERDEPRWLAMAHDGLTWVYASDVAIEVHRPGCARIRPSALRVVVTEADEKADLLARGYEPRLCACTRVLFTRVWSDDDEMEQAE